MPVHSKDGGYQWGNHGKVYHGKGARAKAMAQGKAAYANGYKGKDHDAEHKHVGKHHPKPNTTNHPK